MLNLIIVQVFIPFFMVLLVLRWNKLPNKAFVYGSYLHTPLCFLIHMWYLLEFVQNAMSLGWQTHFCAFPFLLLQICKSNHGCIVSPSLWFNFQRFCLHWQPCSDTRSPHRSTCECFLRFHNYCRQCLVPYKPLLYPRYSWHY